MGVIGGSGFIGSHIVDKLIQSGHSVTDFDIMPPPNPLARHIYVDILDGSKTIIALAGEYDAMYMLAAMANVGDVFRNPTQAVEVNVTGTANVLEAVRRHDIPRVVLASTVWVYSASTADDCTEDSPLTPSKVDHVYTATKIASELLTHSYARLYGIKYTVLRYGIPYGPRARSGTAIAAFVKQAISGKPITVNGDGQQKRRFVYVEDLADANVLALSQKAINRTYNVDGQEEVTIIDLARKVNQLVGPVEIKFVEARPGDYAQKAVSNQLIKLDLGWNPVTPLNVGLRTYIEWYRSVRKK